MMSSDAKTITDERLASIIPGDLVVTPQVVIYRQRRRPKYNNAKTIYNARVYDSAAEAERASQLDQLAAAGEIFWWLPQVSIALPARETTYRVDFLVCDRAATWAEDVKGKRTSAFEAHIRRWKQHGPMELILLTKRRTQVGGWDRECVKGGLQHASDPGPTLREL